MDIRNTRQLKDFSAGRLANARDGQKIILYFSFAPILPVNAASGKEYLMPQTALWLHCKGPFGIIIIGFL